MRGRQRHPLPSVAPSQQSSSQLPGSSWGSANILAIHPPTRHPCSSSTWQAPGHDSEVYLVPRAMYRDPFRGGSNLLVLADCYEPPRVQDDGSVVPMKPLPTNKRFDCAQVMDKASGGQMLGKRASGAEECAATTPALPLLCPGRRLGALVRHRAGVCPAGRKDPLAPGLAHVSPTWSAAAAAAAADGQPARPCGSCSLAYPVPLPPPGTATLAPRAPTTALPGPGPPSAGTCVMPITRPACLLASRSLGVTPRSCRPRQVVLASC